MENKKNEEIVEYLDLLTELVGKKGEKLLAYIDNIQQLRFIDRNVLENLGFTTKEVTKIMSIVTLAKMIYESPYLTNDTFYSASDVYEYIRQDLEYQTQEHLVILLINIKGSLMRKETVYIGASSQIPVSIKEIFKLPIKLSAYGFIMIHNHPTGDSNPSDADNKFTKKIMDAAKLLSIDVIDHIIVGKNEFYSYKNKKVIKV